MSVFAAAHQTCPSLWAGTNNGTVYIFTVGIPAGEQRTNGRAHAQLGETNSLFPKNNEMWNTLIGNLKKNCSTYIYYFFPQPKKSN